VLRRARQVLRLAVKHGGTTFLNFTNFHGKPGNFRRKLRVYGRGGEPCRDCGGTLARTVVGGRGTVLCPHCQMR
jgi:formamidopyrimidine-DNA glycosylase